MLWSRIITSGKIIPLNVRGFGVAITNGGLICYGIFGDVRVFSVWVFTLSDMGEHFPIGGREGGIFCYGGIFYAGGFCVESFTLSEMGDKLPNYADKFPIDGIDGALDK